MEIIYFFNSILNLNCYVPGTTVTIAPSTAARPRPISLAMPSTVDSRVRSNSSITPTASKTKTTPPRRPSVADSKARPNVKPQPNTKPEHLRPKSVALPSAQSLESITTTVAALESVNVGKSNVTTPSKQKPSSLVSNVKPQSMESIPTSATAESPVITRTTGTTPSKKQTSPPSPASKALPVPRKRNLADIKVPSVDSSNITTAVETSALQSNSPSQATVSTVTIDTKEDTLAVLEETRPVNALHDGASNEIIVESSQMHPVCQLSSRYFDSLLTLYCRN